MCWVCSSAFNPHPPQHSLPPVSRRVSRPLAPSSSWLLELCLICFLSPTELIWVCMSRGIEENCHAKASSYLSMIWSPDSWPQTTTKKAADFPFKLLNLKNKGWSSLKSIIPKVDGLVQIEGNLGKAQKDCCARLQGPGCTPLPVPF